MWMHKPWLGRRVLLGSSHDLHCSWKRHAIPYRRFNHDNQGPPKSQLQVIPFSQHIKAAEQTFERYHGGGFFSVRIRNAGFPQEIFLPFWVTTANVRTRILQAQVGRHIMRSRFNPHTRRQEPFWDTEWAWVQDQHDFVRSYHPLQYPELQTYASFKFRRGFVHAIRTGNALEHAKPFAAEDLDRPAYRDLDSGYQRIQRKVDPFTMYPTTALRFAKEFIHTHEQQVVDQFLRDTYGADETRLVDLSITIENVRVSPVYYPAYVYTVQYLGRHLRTFINGNDLTVGGLHIYNWERVAAVSALSMASLMAMTGGVGWGGFSGSFWVGITLPTLITSLLTLYYPILSLRIRDAMRRYEMHHQMQDERRWQTDWTGTWNAQEEEKRYRSWQSEQREAPSRTGSQDAKGYYRLLNVDPSASTADIQSSFRALAMRHHPDRYSDPKDKQAAKVKFQSISEAYSVLRDPKKRKVYDTTGRA